MNKLKMSALILASMLSLVSFSACGDKNSSNSNVSYVENENIGKNKHETNLGSSVTVNNTTFTVHNIIDVNKTTDDGDKYLYVEYTIKNDSDKDFKVDNLNNFYLLINGEKYDNDVRANIYAKQSINNYIELDVVSAGSEIKNYVGFVIPSSTNSITCGYYVTEGEKNDKEDTIICTVESSDWIQAPEGMIK